LDSEILIVDEVLAVGDAEFQKKCLGKMGEVSKGEGRTVLFVSHDMNAIINLCPRVLLLENGQLSVDDLTKIAITAYKKNNLGNKGEWNFTGYKSEAHFAFVEMELLGEQPFFILRINFVINAELKHNPVFVAFDICNSIGTPLMQAIPISIPFINYKNGNQKFTCEVKLNGLIPDAYFISAWMGEHNNQTLDWQKEIISFEVLNSPIKGRNVPHSYSNGSIIPESSILNNQS
jgi:lipopolysaccharide transport system ATP-binding protein